MQTRQLREVRAGWLQHFPRFTQQDIDAARAAFARGECPTVAEAFSADSR